MRIAYVFIAAMALIGCSNQQAEAPLTKEAPLIFTASQVKPQFAIKQLVGKWTATVAFDPRVPMAERQAYAKGMENFSLDLHGDKTFSMNSRGGVATGTWDIIGKSLLVTLLQQGGKPVDQLISAAEKKGVSKQQAEAIKRPAKFDISDDASQLTSETGSSEALVILKR